MNSMTVSFVLVRLAAVFLFVRAVQGLSTFSYLLSGDEKVATFAVITVVFMVILPAAVAIVLWIHPEKVTGAQASVGKSDGPISAQQILMIGVSLLGLYLIVYGVVDLFRIEANHVLQQQLAGDAGMQDDVQRRAMVISRFGYGIQLAMGVFLILGRSGISRLLLKAKYGALPQVVDKD